MIHELSDSAQQNIRGGEEGKLDQLFLETLNRVKTHLNPILCDPGAPVADQPCSNLDRVLPQVSKTILEKNKNVYFLPF